MEKIVDIFEKKASSQYLKSFGKILLGCYASYLGLEINTVFLGITKDLDGMVYWVAYMNLFTLIMTSGTGFAMITRTECSFAFGIPGPIFISV